MVRKVNVRRIERFQLQNTSSVTSDTPASLNGWIWGGSLTSLPANSGLIFRHISYPVEDHASDQP